jgi:hypothetical protein
MVVWRLRLSCTWAHATYASDAPVRCLPGIATGNSHGDNQLSSSLPFYALRKEISRALLWPVDTTKADRT